MRRGLRLPPALPAAPVLLFASFFFLIPVRAGAATLWSVDGATITTAPNDQMSSHGDFGGVSDGAGGFYMVWVDSRSAPASVWAHHLDANGNPVPGWPVNGLQISTTQSGRCANSTVLGTTREVCPAAKADGAGGMLIVWQDWRSGAPQVYAQRMTPGGAALWAANGVLVAASPGASDEAGAPFVADDGSYFVLYYDSAPLAQGGLNWRVQKLNPANGAQLFGPQGVVVTSTTVQAYAVGGPMVSDGANGFYYVWGDKRAGPTQNYAIRVGPTGNKIWEITLSSGPNDQGLYGWTTSDGANGFYAVWTDSRAGGGEIDVYGTRVLQNGTAASGWSIGNGGGNPICVSTGMQNLVSADHIGNDLVAVWWDLRDGALNQKAFSQRMSGATGQPVWALNGVNIFYPTGGFANTVVAPVVRVNAGGIFYAMGWVHVDLCGGFTPCGFDSVVGQAVNPANGATLFGSTGTYLGNEFIVLNPGVVGLPRGYQIVASTGDGTVIVAWAAGAFGNVDLYAQKFSASAGGGGGGGSNTALAPYLAMVSSDTIIAQWTNVPGASFIAALSTDSFNTLVATVTVSTYRSTFTALTPQTTYYFKVKISTESDASYNAALSRKTSASGIAAPAYSTQWGGGGSTNGLFNYPYGIASDAFGNVYVSDLYTNRMQKFDNNGNFLMTWGSTGSANGQFNYPYGIAVDATGGVYVADLLNKRIQKNSVPRAPI